MHSNELVIFSLRSYSDNMQSMKFNFSEFRTDNRIIIGLFQRLLLLKKGPI